MFVQNRKLRYISLIKYKAYFYTHTFKSMEVNSNDLSTVSVKRAYHIMNISSLFMQPS